MIYLSFWMSFTEHSCKLLLKYIIHDLFYIGILQLILTDRSLMPGDVIRRFGEDANSQRGFVQDLSGKCHIHIRGTNKFLYNVNSKDLSSMKIEEIARKVVACHPYWHLSEIVFHSVYLMYWFSLSISMLRDVQTEWGSLTAPFTFLCTV